MILDTTLKSCQVVLGEAITTSNCDITAAFGDYAVSGFLPGGNDTVSNGTTPVTVVAAPSAGVQRLVTEVTVHNNDTVPHTIVLLLNDNGTIRIVRSAIVPAGSDFAYAPGALPVGSSGAGGIPTPTLATALDFIRITAAGTSYEVQTPGQVLTDIAAAPLASPGFTGVPTAPTAAPGTNTIQLASTAFVAAAVTGGAYVLPTATATVLGGVKPDGTTITNTAGAISVTYGTAAGTAAQGNDSRILAAQTAAQVVTAIAAGNPGAFSTLSASGAVSGAGFVTLLTPYAPLASPALTGVPVAPTAAAGTSTTQLATTAFVEAALQASADVGRNLLHNGLFRVQQRGAGAVTANGAYTADRWLIQLSTSTVSDTIVALADADRTAIGDENAEFALQGVVGGSAGAGDFAIPAQQRIEGVQRLSGKTVLISFWAKVNSGTPKVGIELFQNFGSGGSPSSQVTGIGAQAITLSTTWTRYTTTAIAVPSASGKTFGSTANTDYTGLNFWCSSGATNATRASSIGNQSFTLDVWGVQIEVVPATATLATQLEKPDPRYELANCQRFYCTPSAHAIITAAAGAAYLASPVAFAPMRAVPTIAGPFPIVTSTNVGTITADTPTTMGFRAIAQATAGGIAAFSVTWAVTADL